MTSYRLEIQGKVIGSVLLGTVVQSMYEKPISVTLVSDSEAKISAMDSSA